jgi:hypothetical protein
MKHPPISTETRTTALRSVLFFKECGHGWPLLDSTEITNPQSRSNYNQAAVSGRTAKITKRPSLPTAAPDEEERRDSILQDEFSFAASPALRERRVATQPSAVSSAA